MIMANIERDRQIVILHERDGLSPTEIAEQYGLSERRVRGVLQKARGELAGAAPGNALVPAGGEVVEGELVGPAPPARRHAPVLIRPATPDGRPVPYVPPQPLARPSWQTQAERDQSIDDAAAVFEKIRAALAPNTRDAYRAAWLRYWRWCADTHRTPVPADRATVLSFLRAAEKWEKKDGTRGLSISTIRITLAALKRVHSVGGDAAPEWVGGDQEITDWIKTYARELAKDPARQPKRATGARMAIMRYLLDALPDDQPWGVRDRAILLLGYYMAARRSELAALYPSHVRFTVDGLEVLIASSKTDQQGEGAWVAIPINPVHEQYDAITALGAWTEIRAGAGADNTHPLFLPINRYGQIRVVSAAMSGQAFEVLVKRAWGRARAAAKAAKLKKVEILLDPDNGVRLSPHSVRRGFATDARAAGWDFIDITRHGRWSPQSKSAHIYIEEAERWLRHTRNPILL